MHVLDGSGDVPVTAPVLPVEYIGLVGTGTVTVLVDVRVGNVSVLLSEYVSVPGVDHVLLVEEVGLEDSDGIVRVDVLIPGGDEVGYPYDDVVVPVAASVPPVE